jgi:hypothetical protein
VFCRPFASFLALAALIGGCAGAQSVHVDQREHVVRARNDGRQLSYQFGPVPPAWERLRIANNDAAWHDTVSDGVIHVDHVCGRDQDTPLPALVQHLLIGFTDREMVSEETIPFDGREARHVVLRARLDGVPMKLELFVMKKDGCVYDLGYVARPERFERGAPAFRAFVAGFRTLSTGSDAQAAQGAER